MIKSICGSSLLFNRRSEIELNDIKAHLKKHVIDQPDKNLEFNCKLLSNGLNLPKQTWKLIKLLVTMETNPGLNEFIYALLPSDYYINCTIALMLGIKEAELHQCIYMLNQTGLTNCTDSTLFTDIDGLPSAIVAKLFANRAKCYIELIDSILQPLSPSHLSLNDFEYIEKATLLNFLEVAINNSFMGVNILIYGLAGTGKTEFTKVMANTLNAELVSVQSIESFPQRGRHKTTSSTIRLQFLKLVQNIVNHNDKTMLLLDECEDIFAQNLSNYGGGKDLLHHLLESNIIPTVWVTNHIDEIPHSCLRRFSHIVNVEIPDKRVMSKLLDTSLKGLSISKPFKEKLLKNDNIVPSHITNAAFISRTIKQKGKVAEQSIEASINNVLTACGYDSDTQAYKPQIPFSTEFINLKEGDQAVDQIGKAITQHSNVRTLLLGPPGTGKTALVNYLAQQAGKELRTIRCSDVLDKYVGGSEKNIAKIFKQANHDSCILFFDEVDSLLLDRAGLEKSYEIQQVNELLTHMECFEQPFFAATNFATRLDKAVMRRFDFKLSFEFLKPEQVQQLYKQTTKSKILSKAIKAELNNLRSLTPGDFAILARRQKIAGKKFLEQECIGILESENRRKSTNKSIGFI